MKDLDFVKIFDSMKENDISEVVIKEGGKLYEIRRGGFKNSAPVTQAAAQPMPMAIQNTPVQAAAPAAVQAAAEPAQASKAADQADSGCHEIKSPLVGTFYSSPNPDAALFAEVGDKVTKGQTLCIVEAMKNFNEIECDISGVVKEICVKNGDLVEFGQVLFRIEQQ